ncbi:unnamed protein product [Prorocentrum cordatum]|uniref:Uncharacterized protein n=1 Tax=Prorocentrum cordatum TaxID=2364126 RepID=A0ABN9VSQ5_9DINO|nr:unnamed protein product [Polarella glacialis]
MFDADVYNEVTEVAGARFNPSAQTCLGAIGNAIAGSTRGNPKIGIFAKHAKALKQCAPPMVDDVRRANQFGEMADVTDEVLNKAVAEAPSSEALRTLALQLNRAKTKYRSSVRVPAKEAAEKLIGTNVPNLECRFSRVKSKLRRPRRPESTTTTSN